jgi:hypothetical protein
MARLGKDGDVHLCREHRCRRVCVSDLHVDDAFPPVDHPLRERDGDRTSSDHNAEARWQSSGTAVSAVIHGGTSSGSANSASPQRLDAKPVARLLAVLGDKSRTRAHKLLNPNKGKGAGQSITLALIEELALAFKMTPEQFLLPLWRAESAAQLLDEAMQKRWCE